MADETFVNQGAAGAFEPADEPPWGGGQSPLEASREDHDAFSQHPELFVGAAFVGGLALAQVLKRIGT